MLDEVELTNAMEQCRAERALEADPNNSNAKPCFRVPPVMPWRANVSGHCHVVFNVNDKGKTSNIRMNGCTDPILAPHTFEAVRLWVFLPKLVDGKPVAFKDVENKISFRLRDQNGTFIEEPPRFRENPDHVHTNSIDVPRKSDTEK